MTGGTSGGMEARSKQWDDKKIEGWCQLYIFKPFGLSLTAVGM